MHRTSKVLGKLSGIGVLIVRFVNLMQVMQKLVLNVLLVFHVHVWVLVPVVLVPVVVFVFGFEVHVVAGAETEIWQSVALGEVHPLLSGHSPIMVRVDHLQHCPHHLILVFFGNSFVVVVLAHPASVSNDRVTGQAVNVQNVRLGPVAFVFQVVEKEKRQRIKLVHLVFFLHVPSLPREIGRFWSRFPMCQSVSGAQ
ncbi:hypothetical protein CLUG_05562 [Clavispora lusitaniae ATCC 42720]|uniref:Uncharacterized protein n=1 Tax=Clavispora lusitaniae (strain ATCC 42720) TaxID=306902 RepID=C4YBI4_CLAL4|nr:uncharacterized protein CLUG_05562 [Clavispora lusitaniae ATCC 42720]EEQ41434.1 hypothetical protein CLUG_05562 [Clavispora lusitaniae ATCC 42720]